MSLNFQWINPHRSKSGCSVGSFSCSFKMRWILYFSLFVSLTLDSADSPHKISWLGSDGAPRLKRFRSSVEKVLSDKKEFFKYSVGFFKVFLAYCSNLRQDKPCCCSSSYYLEPLRYFLLYWLTLSFLHLHSRNWLCSPQFVFSSSLHLLPPLFFPYFLLSPLNLFCSFWTSLLSVHLTYKYCLDIAFTYAIDLRVKAKWIYYFRFYWWNSLIQKDFDFVHLK